MHICSCELCHCTCYFLSQCLKNKLGTRQLPTAELLLDGTKAKMVSDLAVFVNQNKLSVAALNNPLPVVI